MEDSEGGFIKKCENREYDSFAVNFHSRFIGFNTYEMPFLIRLK